MKSIEQIIGFEKDGIIHNSETNHASYLLLLKNIEYAMANGFVPNYGKVKSTKTIQQLEAERFEWSLKTFPESTAFSSLQKLKEEIKEIEHDIEFNIKRPEEYADALMLLFDSANRQGITPDNIFEAFETKLAVNLKRDWKKNSDNTYSHVK